MHILFTCGCYRYMHILFNMIFQLVFGLPLEIVHKAWRVALVYLLGVIAGAQFCSSFWLGLLVGACTNLRIIMVVGWHISICFQLRVPCCQSYFHRSPRKRNCGVFSFLNFFMSESVHWWECVDFGLSLVTALMLAYLQTLCKGRFL